MLKLKNGASYNSTQGFKSMIYNSYDITNFVATDLELDCNWNGQSTTTGQEDYKVKIGGLSIRCVAGEVNRCDVFNFGSKQPSGQTSDYPEVFPLALTGVNVTDPPSVNLAIRYCKVHTFYGVNGGYCTAINIVTLDPYQAGQEQPYLSSSASSDSTPICVVEHNEVWCCWGGIGMGGRNVQMAAYTNNRIRECFAGFNCDTAGMDPPSTDNPYRNRVVLFENNDFLSVDKGINIGASGWNTTETFNGFTIRNNTFKIRGLCTLNSSTSSDSTGVDPDEVNCEAYALRLGGGTGNISFTSNAISSVHDSSYSPSSSSSCDGTVPTSQSGNYYLGVKKLTSETNGTPTLSSNTPTAANQVNKKIFPS